MGSLRKSRPFAVIAGAAVLAALMAGCTEGDPAEPPVVESSAPSSATPTTAPGAEDPSVLQIPEVTDKEIARAISALPADDPTSSNTVEDAVVAGEPLILEGACVGETARYQIRSAVVDGDGEILERGTLTCNEALYEELTLDVDGPVQLSFTDTEDIDAGWLLLTRVGNGE